MRAITTEEAAGLRACNRCGIKPAELAADALPRVVSVPAFGKHWKSRLICWGCGAYVEAPDVVRVLAKWNVPAFWGNFLEEKDMKAMEAAQEAG